MGSINCKLSVPILKYELHSHNDWEIVCQLVGEAKTQVGDKTFALSPGEIMLIPPNVNHKGSSDGYFMDISLRGSDISFGKFEVLKDYRGDIAALISMIYRICIEQEGACNSVADALVSAVCRMIRHEIGNNSGHPAVEQIKKEIYDNLSNPKFSLASAIADTGFDKDYFRRCFKQETGKTPTQYITDMRIVKAKQLLSDSKFFSVEAIAHSCGFSDSLYFSTCFKKHVGVSPLAYRKSLINKTSRTQKTPCEDAAPFDSCESV